MDVNVESVGKFLVLKKDNAISEHARQHGTIAYDDTLRNMPELVSLPPGSRVFDVGAYIGDSTRVLLDMGFEVHAFEPIPDAFKCLCHNCPEAHNLQYAIGDGRLVQLDTDNQCGNMGARSLLPFKPKGDCVRTILMDDYGLTPVAIKIDVEGFEPAVLAGAAKLLTHQKLKCVMVEFNPTALIRFGWVCQDILQYFEGWEQREFYRYYEENWDIVFSRP